ncbi:hypothetical protein [Kribbella sp. NPDC003557]|uniref:hypothetical protein n=1 Tax=Kribbella sp. NPDC003557 TaxID=3154449 RepID=UPI0033BAA5DA
MSASQTVGSNISAISSIVDAWTAYEGATVPQGPLTRRLDGFPRIGTNGVNRCKARLEKVNWLAVDDGFVVGAPIVVAEPALVPVALILMRKPGDTLEISIRVATYFVRSGEVDVHGWRFDMGDPMPKSGPEKKPSPRAHYFPHAQRIAGWSMNAPAGLGYEDFYAHANAVADESLEVEGGSEDGDINETRPAFPLRSRSSPGLLVCALAALYGSSVTREILEAAPSLPSWLLEESRHIIGI